MAAMSEAAISNAPFCRSSALNCVSDIARPFYFIRLFFAIEKAYNSALLEHRDLPNGGVVTDWERMLVSIAVAAAKNCIHVFEAEHPADNRPRMALEAAEKWLTEPTRENRRAVIEAENRVWRAKDWTGRAGSAAEACGFAARTARHPQSSAMHAIWCEAYANGVEPGDYSRKWLWSVLGRFGSHMERIDESRRAS